MRRMDIERLLKWAYVEELPKEQILAGLATRGDGVAPGWLKMQKIASMQTVIDEPNRHGVLPDPHSLVPPHPDALRVAEAVALLDGLEMALPEGWDPFEDIEGEEERRLAGHGAVQAINSLTLRDRNGARKLRDPLEMLVIKHAILGGSPSWEAEPFTVEVSRGANGKPAWYRHVVVGEGREAREIRVDGYNAKAQRPYDDAFQVRYLEPDAKAVAVERAEYEIWHAALGFLVEELAGRLESFILEPSPRPARPWESGDIRPPRILFAICA